MRIFRILANDVAAARDTYKGLGLVASLFTFLQGRATAFAIIFSGVGIYGFLKHYDLTSYAAFVAAIFTGVVGHSIKEDYFQLRHRQLDEQHKDLTTAKQ